MLIAFATSLGLDPVEIAVVGDAVHDLEMGARGGAGLKVAVLSGTSPHEVLAPHADLILESIVGLPASLAPHTS
jgi:phosphoglycolate phosphatase